VWGEENKTKPGALEELKKTGTGHVGVDTPDSWGRVEEHSAEKVIRDRKGSEIRCPPKGKARIRHGIGGEKDKKNE